MAPRGRLHAALGIDEEGARDHDPLAERQPFRHLDVAAHAPPRFDQPRFEVSVAVFDEHRLAQPRVHDRICRHDERRREVDRELHVHEHPGLERPPRVGRLESHLQRQRRLVENRFRRAHRGRQRTAAFRRGDPRGGATADERQVAAVHVGKNPHAAQVRDPVELEAAIESEAGRDAAFQHDAVHRRFHADVRHELAALAHLAELRVGDAQGPQLVRHALDHRGAAHGSVRLRPRLRLRLRLCDDHAVERFEAGVVRLLRTSELDLRRQERREHLVLFHGVARRDVLNAADPAAHGGDDRIGPVLVGHHAPGRAQQPGAGQPLDDCRAERRSPAAARDSPAPRPAAARRRGVAARCCSRTLRLEAHAADRAVARMVALVVRVHRAGVDGCSVRARRVPRRTGPPTRCRRRTSRRQGKQRQL